MGIFRISGEMTGAFVLCISTKAVKKNLKKIQRLKQNQKTPFPALEVIERFLSNLSRRSKSANNSRATKEDLNLQESSPMSPNHPARSKIQYHKTMKCYLLCYPSQKTSFGHKSVSARELDERQ